MTAWLMVTLAAIVVLLILLVRLTRYVRDWERTMADERPPYLLTDKAERELTRKGGR